MEQIPIKPEMSHEQQISENMDFPMNNENLPMMEELFDTIIVNLERKLTYCQRAKQEYLKEKKLLKKRNLKAYREIFPKRMVQAKVPLKAIGNQRENTGESSRADDCVKENRLTEVSTSVPRTTVQIQARNEILNHEDNVSKILAILPVQQTPLTSVHEWYLDKDGLAMRNMKEVMAGECLENIEMLHPQTVQWMEERFPESFIPGWALQRND